MVMLFPGVRSSQKAFLRAMKYLRPVLDLNRYFHVYIKDPVSLRFVWVNLPCADVYGMRPADLVGLHDRDLFNQSDARMFEDEDRSVVESGKPIVHTHTRSHFPAHARWAVDTKFLVHDHRNRPLVLIGISILSVDSPPDKDNFRTNLEMRDAILSGISQREFVLHFQPMVNRQGRIDRAEALLRWQRDGQLLQPVQFIPFAEDAGLMRELGAEVVRLACETLKLWRENSLTSDLQLAINISPRQLDSGLIETIRRNLTDSGALPERLRLELTESALDALSHHDDTLKVLHALTYDLGLGISIDDFGQECSCLSRLGAYPVDEIKLDKCFVDLLPGAEGAQAAKIRGIIQSIVIMAHTIDCRVVAEGIETIEQLRSLNYMGVDSFQGFLDSLHKPVPATRFLELLARNREQAVSW